MRAYCILSFLLIATYSTMGQAFSSYEKPIATNLYSDALNDSVNLEIIVPKELKQQTNTAYPIVYLLDKQLYNNYKYNLYTIDYLSSLQWMPNAIIVGITFPWKNRTSWTVPNASGGKADDLILFIEKELNHELKSKYPISDFNLLIGHSRTAIFSSYALSKKPDFFNGVIANSVSNFDFGDDGQQKQFEVFLNEIVSSPHNYYYYFSVGEASYGDLHELAVDTLNHYLSSRKLPDNFQWKYYKYKVPHDLTPGVTVSNALSDLFKDYGRRIELCFDLANKSKNEVPWNDFREVYSSISSELGFKIEPSELFFNSIASMYYNDYEGVYGDKHLDFTLEILLRAVEKYPNDYGHYSWIGEIYITLNELEKGNHYLNKAIEHINKDKSISESDRRTYLEEIEALRKTK